MGQITSHSWWQTSETNLRVLCSVDQVSSLNLTSNKYKNISKTRKNKNNQVIQLWFSIFMEISFSFLWQNSVTKKNLVCAIVHEKKTVLEKNSN